MSLVLPDTSVWARGNQPAVAGALSRAIEEDRVLVTQPIVLELLRGARDLRELVRKSRQYDALPCVELTSRHMRRAREVQQALGWKGYHRGPSAVDLITAAAAEEVAAVLWHCDRHFALIAEVTGQQVRRVGA